jgi:CRISPR-associated protein Cmr2
MTTHLFLFTIGPVQDFIAQARKTRDLYAGSQILSELLAEGMRAFEKEFSSSGQIIFPKTELSQGTASLPNRFIGKITGNESELKPKAEAIVHAVEAEWMKIAKKSLKKAGVDLIPEGFESQIKALLDIHWVFNEIKSDYAQAYQELERLGGAVKNIRKFTQLAEAGRKCSIDGMNNAIFYQKRSKDKKAPAFMARPIPVPGFSLSLDEGLSAVSLTKRFYPVDEKFPSTAGVALMNDIQKLSPENQERLECFKNLFKKDKVSGTCLKMFINGEIENASINPLEEQDWNEDWDEHFLFEENLEKIENLKQKALLHVLHRALKKDLKTRYYAIILFDGDNMGKWLSGEKNQTRGNLEEFHTELSSALARFGKKAREYLNKDHHNGQTVYSGGDDFLGFVNIHHLFEVMKNLRGMFDEMVNTAIDPYKRSGEQLTFSAGIVVAHYKTPFSEVLKKARRIEKAAKNEGERNAFGIAVMKHSGEVQEATYKWDTDEANASDCSNWEALEKIYNELDKDTGNFSNTFITNLTNEIQRLTGVDMQNFSASGNGKTVNAVIPKEIQRLVERAWKEGQEKDNIKVEALGKEVINLWEKVPKESAFRPRNFIHALHIADFLTRKITQES